LIDDINDLLQIAHIYHIKIVCRNLHAKNQCFEGYAWPTRKLIVLETTLLSRPQDYVCILAEEIGHILNPPAFSSVSYHYKDYWKMDCLKRDEAKYQYAKTERSALLWATNYLISDEDFWEFAKDGTREWWEWLERFEVPDWFMRWKIGFMRTKQRFKCREIISRPPQGGF